MTSAPQVSVQKPRERREDFDKLQGDLLCKGVNCHSAPSHHYPMGTSVSLARCLSFYRYNENAKHFQSEIVRQLIKKKIETLWANIAGQKTKPNLYRSNVTPKTTGLQPSDFCFCLFRLVYFLIIYSLHSEKKKK